MSLPPATIQGLPKQTMGYLDLYLYRGIFCSLYRLNLTMPVTLLYIFFSLIQLFLSLLKCCFQTNDKILTRRCHKIGKTLSVTTTIQAHFRIGTRVVFM